MSHNRLILSSLPNLLQGYSWEDFERVLAFCFIKSDSAFKIIQQNVAVIKSQMNCLSIV